MNNSKFPYWFKGDLDEVRIYNRAINFNEIQELCKVSEPEKKPVIDFTYKINKCNEVQFDIIKKENISSFKWNFGGNAISSKDNIVHIYKKSGTYNVTIKAIGLNGETIKMEKAITLRNIKIDFSYNIDVEKQICFFSITDKSKFNYQWSFGDGTFSKKNKKVSHYYEQPQNYKVVLTATDKNGCTDTAIKLITIVEPNFKKDSLASIPKQVVYSTSPNLRDSIFIAQRDVNVIKELEVTSDSLTILLYDNAIIDGDSVTILFNNVIVRSKQKLSDKPIELKVKIEKSLLFNELVMYAENLGTIPPNTASMIIYDNKKRYDVEMSSNLNSSGVVRFKLKK